MGVAEGEKTRRTRGGARPAWADTASLCSSALLERHLTSDKLQFYAGRPAGYSQRTLLSGVKRETASPVVTI